MVEEYKKQLMDEYNNPDKYDEPGDLPSYLEEELIYRGIGVELIVKYDINVNIYSKQ